LERAAEKISSLKNEAKTDYDNQKVNVNEVKIEKFNGGPRGCQLWEQWWPQWKVLVHDKQQMDGHKKLVFLRTILTGEALTTINSYPPTAKGYLMAIESLVAAYGHPSFAVIGYHRDLAQLKKKDDMSYSALHALYQQTLLAITGLKAHKIDVNTTGVMSACISAFPSKMYEEYIKLKHREDMPLWATDVDSMILWFLAYKGEKMLAIHSQDNNPSVEKQQQSKKKAEEELKKKGSNQKVAGATASGGADVEPAGTAAATAGWKGGDKQKKVEGDKKKAGPKPGEKKTRMPCFLCEALNHHPSKCPKLADFTVDQRFEKAKELKICFTCLIDTHHSSKCPQKKECPEAGCSSNHNPIMHGGKGKPAKTD
jgi:hypothetical protein